MGTSPSYNDRSDRASGLSVHIRTQHGQGESDGQRSWLLRAYPATREAVIVLQGGSREGSALPSEARTEEEQERRDKANLARANRRRRAEMRRYMVQNKLTVLWTFTYAGEGEHNRERVLADFAAFLRRFREAFGRHPYLYVFELHPGGHGWHVHCALPGLHFSHKRMGELWGHGFVHYRKAKDFFAGDDDGQGDELGGGRGGRQDARRLSKYLAKYMAKDMDPGKRRHGYEVGEGFSVRVRTFRLLPSLSAVRKLVNHLGLGELSWHSSDIWKGWEGPPMYVLAEGWR